MCGIEKAEAEFFLQLSRVVFCDALHGSIEVIQKNIVDAVKRVKIETTVRKKTPNNK